MDEDEIRSAESLQFDFDTIIAATENFSDANKLGQGEFGVVYKVMSVKFFFLFFVRKIYQVSQKHVKYKTQNFPRVK